MSEPNIVDQEPQTGLTRTEIVFSVEVLDSLGDFFAHQDMRDEEYIMNKALELVNEFRSDCQFEVIRIA
jgi:hypothetical protein